MGWPGYISTTSKTIDDFKNEITPLNTNIEGYFFDSLNMTISFLHPITGYRVTCNDYMNEVFGGYTCAHISLKDHSKILAFIEFEQQITQKDITKELKKGNFKVNALLVGSSNQSANTYCNSPAPKGEADVFMIEVDGVDDIETEKQLIRSVLGYTSELYEEQTIINENANIIISKELNNFKSKTNLKDIVMKLLDEII